MKCYPLELLKKTNLDEVGFPVLKGYAERNGLSILSGMDRKEFIRFCSDKDQFYTMDCLPKYQPLNRFLEQLVASGLFSPRIIERIQNGQADVATELKDVLMAGDLWYEWSRNKQVYKPDPEFMRALIGTETVELTRASLTHLPANTFYVDFSDIAGMKPLVGGLVDVEDYGTKAAITVYLLTESLEYFSFYTGGDYDDKGILTVTTKNLPTVIPDVDCYGVVYPDGSERRYEGISVGRRAASLFCILMLCYLASKEPEVTESEVTKKTYRKPNPKLPPKNKFSEVEIHEVGVRYGTAVRLSEQKKKEPENEKQDDDVSGKTKRRSPAAHFRRAHWQRYWTGAGRKIPVNEWIAPVWVMGEHRDTDVVIHKVYS